MPRHLTFAAALVALLPLAACGRPGGGASGPVPDGPGIAFSATGFDEALERARNERKLVLVDVYTDWCGWCKKLDKEVFADARVAAAARDLIAVRVNAEKGGEKVAERFDVQGYPTVLFVDGAGKVVKRVDGYVDVDEMLQILSALPKA